MTHAPSDDRIGGHCHRTDARHIRFATGPESGRNEAEYDE
jgi:hypothetical protein